MLLIINKELYTRPGKIPLKIETSSFNLILIDKSVTLLNKLYTGAFMEM